MLKILNCSKTKKPQNFRLYRRVYNEMESGSLISYYCSQKATSMIGFLFSFSILNMYELLHKYTEGHTPFPGSTNECMFQPTSQFFTLWTRSKEKQILAGEGTVTVEFSCYSALPTQVNVYENLTVNLGNTIWTKTKWQVVHETVFIKLTQVLIRWKGGTWTCLQWLCWDPKGSALTSESAQRLHQAGISSFTWE